MKDACRAHRTQDPGLLAWYISRNAWLPGRAALEGTAQSILSTPVETYTRACDTLQRTNTVERRRRSACCVRVRGFLSSVRELPKQRTNTRLLTSDQS